MNVGRVNRSETGFLGEGFLGRVLLGSLLSGREREKRSMRMSWPSRAAARAWVRVAALH